MLGRALAPQPRPEGAGVSGRRSQFLRYERLASVTWRFLAIHYGCSALIHHLLRSSRWSDDEKTVYLSMVGMLLSIPFVACQVLWLLTGRGPIRWLYRPTSVAFVDPFPRWQWKPSEEAWDRYIAEVRAKYGDELQFEPPIPSR